MDKVTKYFQQNYHYYKLDEYYGIDIQAELYRLVKDCIEEYNEATTNSD